MSQKVRFLTQTRKTREESFSPWRLAVPAALAGWRLQVGWPGVRLNRSRLRFLWLR